MKIIGLKFIMNGGVYDIKELSLRIFLNIFIVYLNGVPFLQKYICCEDYSEVEIDFGRTPYRKKKMKKFNIFVHFATFRKGTYTLFLHCMLSPRPLFIHVYKDGTFFIDNF